MGFWIFIALVVLFVGSAIYVGNRRGEANAGDGVIASWEGLRVTRTELIECYSQPALRHPLHGLTARVEDSGTNIRQGGGRDDRRIHVIVEGPNTAVVKTKKVASTYNADASARNFAATLNMAKPPARPSE
jgi:hypothetical protein